MRIERTVTWLPSWIRTHELVLWPVILYRRGRRSPAVEDRARRRWTQMWHGLGVGYLVAYAWCALVYGPDDWNPMERSLTEVTRWRPM